MSDTLAASAGHSILGVTAVFALVGAMLIIGSTLYVITALVAAWIMRGMPDAVYTYRETAPEQIRALIVLPLISILVAIISGVGVNVSTDGRGGLALEIGVMAIVGAVFLTIYMGYLLVFNPPAQHSDRRLQLRLARLRNSLDEDAFVSVDRAVQLLPQLARARQSRTVCR